MVVIIQQNDEGMQSAKRRSGPQLLHYEGVDFSKGGSLLREFWWDLAGTAQVTTQLGFLYKM